MKFTGAAKAGLCRITPVDLRLIHRRCGPAHGCRRPLKKILSDPGHAVTVPRQSLPDRCVRSSHSFARVSRMNRRAIQLIVEHTGEPLGRNRNALRPRAPVPHSR